VDDQLRPSSDDRQQILLGRGHGHEAGTDAQACFAGQTYRPGHTGPAADDQYPAEFPLMRLAASGRECVRDIRLGQSLEQRAETRLIGGGYLQVVEHQSTGKLRSSAEKQTSLQG